MRAVPAVVEVTAGAVRVLSGGSGQHPSRALVESALDWIDDPVGLFDERPVAVADMWRSVVATLLGPRCGPVIVVHPADWSRSRVDRVVAAVNTVADHIEAVSADSWVGITATKVAAGNAGEAVRRRPSRWFLTLGALVLSGAAVWAWPLGGRGTPGNTLFEGRMAVRVPAHWHAHRVTDGPGSRRLQVTSPDDPTIALHLTSSYAPEKTLADTAEMLGRAIADEPPGVFADLRVRANVAGRPAVTYRESRTGKVIEWAVVQAGSTRISIGCQSPPGRESEVRAVCDQAVRSASEI